MNIRSKLPTIAIWFFSIAFLFVGNMVATHGLNVFAEEEELTVFSAVVTQIVERDDWRVEMGAGFYIENSLITFNARITSGEARGQYVLADHYLDGMLITPIKEVEVGDRILIFYDPFLELYTFIDYVRINYIVILGLVFFALMVLFGGRKGFNSIIALGFTCVAIFMVLVPAILSGRNIYITTLVVCVYIIASTLLTVIGPGKKSVSAMLGCLGGVLLAALLMFIMDIILNLTGVVDHDSQFLLALPVDPPLSLSAVVFAGVIIGAVGAIMDVAMSISSSLWEVNLAGGDMSFRAVFRAGLNIGKDILGTMLNTLILAYIGSALSLILLLTFYAQGTSLLELFNREMIAVELLRAIIGSFGIFLAVPLTSGICGLLYTQKPEAQTSYNSNW